MPKNTISYWGHAKKYNIILGTCQKIQYHIGDMPKNTISYWGHAKKYNIILRTVTELLKTTTLKYLTVCMSCVCVSVCYYNKSKQNSPGNFKFEYTVVYENNQY